MKYYLGNRYDFHLVALAESNRKVEDLGRKKNFDVMVEVWPLKSENFRASCRTFDDPSWWLSVAILWPLASSTAVFPVSTSQK